MTGRKRQVLIAAMEQMAAESKNEETPKLKNNETPRLSRSELIKHFDKQYQILTTIFLPREIHTKIKIHCAETGITIKYFITKTIVDAINKGKY